MLIKKSYHQELIGETVEIVSSRNKSYLGIKGKIVDETKMTIKIKCSAGIKTLLKNGLTFKIIKTGLAIVGKDILKRPDERLK